jgi:hypothetical protein
MATWPGVAVTDGADAKALGTLPAAIEAVADEEVPWPIEFTAVTLKL